jgi:hypothetical protein
VLSCHRSREESKDRLRSRPEWSETERRYSVGERGFGLFMVCERWHVYVVH